MADRVRKVGYVYLTVPNRAGQGARILGALKQAGVSLVAYSGFPTDGGIAQIDLVAEKPAAVRRVATKAGFKASKVKKGFLIQGKDEVGAVHRHVRRLADAGVSVTAADAVSAGGGRYAMILWVKPKSYAKAARALGAK